MISQYYYFNKSLNHYHKSVFVALRNFHAASMTKTACVFEREIKLNFDIIMTHLTNMYFDK